MSKILDVYLHERLTGKLTQTNEGKLVFQYIDEYLSDQDSPKISISMPKQAEPFKDKKVRAFFSGLLPEERARYQIAKCLGVSEKNPFSLLALIGGECAGAIALYPESEKPPEPQEKDLEILDNQKLLEILEILRIRPLMTGTDNIRLSLAGAQDKLAVGMLGNKIALIHGATPTTHILKPIIAGIHDSVHNEYFCMCLAASMQIPAPKTNILWAGDTPCYIIERYDRIITTGNTIKRLHQEDFCQVLGVMPELKYENEGGPNIAQSLEILEDYSLQPAADRKSFIQRVIFNYLIGNADAHSKNFSLLYQDKEPTLAPAYDLLCTEVYPNVSLKMAMKIGGKYDPYAVHMRHWHQLVPDTAAAKNDLTKEIMRMAAECLEKAELLNLRLKQEGTNSTVHDAIIAVIKKRIAHLKR
jgi:serine/threonine-protein kinase HipA